VKWLRRLFNREEYVVHRVDIPVSTIVRWYMYDTSLYDENDLAELIGLTRVSQEGHVKEQEDSDNRLLEIQQYVPFLEQMAEISANILTTIQLKEIDDSEELSALADGMPTEIMHSLFKAVALSTLIGTFSVGTHLQIINPTSAPTGFINMEDIDEQPDL
jgi:hypothetical protein